MVVAAVRSHTVSDFKLYNYVPSYTVISYSFYSVFRWSHLSKDKSGEKKPVGLFSTNTLAQMYNSQLNATDLLTTCSKDQL